jgi:hypothetical protein
MLEQGNSTSYIPWAMYSVDCTFLFFGQIFPMLCCSCLSPEVCFVSYKYNYPWLVRFWQVRITMMHDARLHCNGFPRLTVVPSNFLQFPPISYVIFSVEGASGVVSLSLTWPTTQHSTSPLTTSGLASLFASNLLIFGAIAPPWCDSNQ